MNELTGPQDVFCPVGLFLQEEELFRNSSAFAAKVLSNHESFTERRQQANE
jgi:hypothetical protein